MTRKKILALDASLTSTGWALEGLCGTLKTKLRGTERLVWIRDQVLDLARDVDLVVIEGYAYARANQAHQMGELGGVLRVALHEAGIPLAIVSPNSRAKYATGTGNAKKEHVLVEAVRRLDYRGSSNDEADALWLWYMALDHYGSAGKVDLPQKHREALQKVDWPE